MKKFTKHIALFTLCYILIFLVGNRALMHKVHSKFLGKQDFKTLVLGDSGMFMMNEHYLENSINLSQKGSIYKVMYYKLMDIDRHTDFSNVVIPLSYSNISAYSDKVLSGLSNTEEYIRRLYPITPLWKLFSDGTDKMTAMKVTLKYLFTFNLQYFKSLLSGESEKYFRDPKFTAIKSRSIPKPKFEPQALATGQKHTDYLVNRIPNLFYLETGNDLSFSSINYLQKIVNYCTENRIELFLVQMPLSDDYVSQVPSACISKYDELNSIYSKASSVHVVSFSKYFGNAESTHNFANDDHLTAYGCSLISSELNNLINNVQ